jgi:hypothetical protein
MAKSKHSPALFEVVHGKKQLDKRAREGVLRTPNWWFKSRKRDLGTGAIAVVDEPPAFVDSEDDPTAGRSLSGPFSAPTRPEPEPLPEPVSDPTEPSLELTISPTLPRRAKSPIDIRIDSDRQEVFLRVRYTTAIVSGFALVVLIALAYIVGRHLGRGPSGALAYQRSEDVAEGPIETGVLDVRRNGAPSANTASLGSGLPLGANRPAAARTGESTATTQGLTGQGAGQVAPQPPRPAGPAIEPKPGVVEGARRTIGLNYVVVQSFPEKEKQMADEAAEYLNRAGIPCTIEKGVVGYTTAGWYCVVGTSGFEKASGPAYTKYLEDIEKVNKMYAGKSRFKRFTPDPVRWRGTPGQR